MGLTSSQFWLEVSRCWFKGFVDCNISLGKLENSHTAMPAVLSSVLISVLYSL